MVKVNVDTDHDFSHEFISQKNVLVPHPGHFKTHLSRSPLYHTHSTVHKYSDKYSEVFPSFSQLTSMTCMVEREMDGSP